MLWLATAPAAAAEVPGPTIPSSYERVAAAYWHRGTPCASSAFTYTETTLLNALGQTHSGQPACSVHISPSLPRRGKPWVCTIVAHEYGHTIGKEHEAGDPVMAAVLRRPAAFCNYAYAAHPCAHTRNPGCLRRVSYWRMSKRAPAGQLSKRAAPS